MTAKRLLYLGLCLGLHAGVARGQGGGKPLQLWTCEPASQAWQQWTVNPNGNHQIVLRSNGDCMDVEEYSTDDEATVWTYACHPDDKDPKHQNQQWSVNPANKTITQLMSGKCLDRSNYGTTPGTQVWLYHCTGSFNQQWYVNATDGTIRASDSGLCLDAGTVLPRPCDTDPARSLPYCDTKLSIDARVADLVSRLNQAEMISQLSNGAGPLARLGIPAWQWWSEGLHGVAGSPGVSFGGPVPAATSFPQVITTGSSFNRTAFHLIGAAVSTEARAMSNVGRAGLTYWAPNINIFRDPRWGRGQETPGEDPYLTSEYAAQFVPGMQGNPSEGNGFLKVSSCCKHYFVYNLENWHGMDRYHFNAITTQQDLADTYLPTFESCVRRGGASSIMCSYNAVNGVPSCANQPYLNGLARSSWGFDGYVTSDCGAVDCVYGDHHYTKTPEDTCKVTLEAGMDIDCGGFLNAHTKSALDGNVMPASDVVQALKNLFRVRFRLGEFDPASSQPYMQYNYTNTVNTPAHQRLALEVAQQGIVLMKNTGDTLPLSADAAGLSVAVIGPSADATSTLQGNYFGTAPYLISPIQGIQHYAPAARLSKGCADVACVTATGFPAAVALASQADVTVLVVGLDQGQESEGHDRETLTLPGQQESLVHQVAAAAKGRVVVVVMSGGPVDIGSIRDDPKVGAILFVGYPGQSGGQAIADVLWGTVNPAGRLTVTWYPAAYVNQTLMTDVNMRPNATAGTPGRTYRFYTGEPVFPFGLGLSYTTFQVTTKLSGIQLSAGTLGQWAAEAMRRKTFLDDLAPVVGAASVTVTNTGKRAGDYVALLYSTPPNPGQNGAPLKSLISFERVSLQPGQSVTIDFPLNAQHFTLTAPDGTRYAEKGDWRLVVGDEEASIPVHVI